MSCWPPRERDLYTGPPCCRCYGCVLCFNPINDDNHWTETKHGNVISLRTRPNWKVLNVSVSSGHVYYTKVESLPSKKYVYKAVLPVELITTPSDSIYVQGNEVFFYEKVMFATVVKLYPTRLEEIQQVYTHRLKATSDAEYHTSRAELIVQVGKVQPLNTEALHELMYSLEQLPKNTAVDGITWDEPKCKGQFGRFQRLRGTGFDLLIKYQDVSDEYHKIIYLREREMTEYVSRWNELQEAKLSPELVYHDDSKGMLVMKWIPNIGSLREVLESDISTQDKLVIIRDCFQLLALLHQRMMHLDAHIENFLIRPLTEHEVGWSRLFKSTIGRPVLIDYSFSHIFDGESRSNLSDVFVDREELLDDLPGFDLNYLAGGIILTLLVELEVSETNKKLYKLLVELTEENWKRVLPDHTVDDLIKLYTDIHEYPNDTELISEVIKVSNYFPDPFDRCIVQEQIPDPNESGKTITLSNVVKMVDDIIGS